MSLKSSVFIATSLDGYISREDGSLDWLDNIMKKVPQDEDCGYLSFLDSVDVLAIGKTSFEKVLSFGQWPYREKPVYVLTDQTFDISDELKNDVYISSESPEELYERLSKEGFNHLYIDGGVSIQRFLAAGLINDITIITVPLIIGKGQSLFGGLGRDVSLKHIATESYDFGFTKSSYQVEKNIAQLH